MFCGGLQDAAVDRLGSKACNFNNSKQTSLYGVQPPSPPCPPLLGLLCRRSHIRCPIHGLRILPANLLGNVGWKECIHQRCVPRLLDFTTCFSSAMCSHLLPRIPGNISYGHIRICGCKVRLASNSGSVEPTITRIVFLVN